MYHLVNKKTDKYHSMPDIRARFTGFDNEYVIKKGNSAKEIRLSFDYVAFKCEKLLAWLRAQGIGGDIWLDSMYGAMSGLRLYYKTEFKVINVCRERGLECEVMLCEELKGLEGLKIRVELRSGGVYEGELARLGKTGIKSHCIIKEGRARPMYIKAYDLKSVSIL